MTFRVGLLPAAVRQLRRLDPPTRRRVHAAIDRLAEEPRSPGARTLVGGSDDLRVRIGDHRIVYQVEDDVLLVLVIALGHRRDSQRR